MQRLNVPQIKKSRGQRGKEAKGKKKRFTHKQRSKVTSLVLELLVSAKILLKIIFVAKIFYF